LATVRQLFFIYCNIDFPEPLPPPLHPGTKEPMPPEALEAIFPKNLIEQEISAEKYIEIPEPVRDIYALWRPTPLLRAVRLEKALNTPAHIYYKYEGRQSRRQPQGQHLRAAGVLQQNRRHQAARHGNRRGPVGFVAGVRVQFVRAGMQCLHGQGQLRPEAVSPDAHAHLGRDGSRESERPDGIRPQAAGRRSAFIPAASASPSARPSRTRSKRRTRNIRSAAC
jgi:hypothetical protein